MQKQKIELRPTRPVEQEASVEGGERYSYSGQEYSASKVESVADSTPLTRVTTPPLPSLEKSPMVQKVEGVLEQDLEDLYKDLSEAEKVIFKQKGEETASVIVQILQGAKIRAKHLFEAIVAWLKYLPGVSASYIVQEAKIKTDQLMKLVKK